MMKCSIFCPFPFCSYSKKCKGKWSVRTSSSSPKKVKPRKKPKIEFAWGNSMMIKMPKILWVVISYLFYAVILWKKECHAIKSSPWHDGSSSSHTFLYQKNWFIQCCCPCFQQGKALLHPQKQNGLFRKAHILSTKMANPKMYEWLRFTYN